MKKLPLIITAIITAGFVTAFFLYRENKAPELATQQTLLPTNTIYEKEQALNAGDVCEWRYYYWGKALLVDTIPVQGAELTTLPGTPGGVTLTAGYIVDRDQWDPEQTIRINRPINMQEAQSIVRPPYGHVEKWIEGPYLYLVQRGCKDITAENDDKLPG